LGFGPYNQNLKLKISKDMIKSDEKPKKGMILKMRRGDSFQTEVRVVELGDSYVIVDANHELAGKELILDIQLLEILKR
jgi:peptidylprolyl isomerase